MLFSVVIPTYNRALKVKRAIDSVLNQAEDLSLVEIIVVDDGSTDHTVRFLQPYIKAGKIKYVKHSVNQGVAVAKNTGILTAQNEYVMLLDSDDLLDKGGMAHLIRLVEDKRYDIVFSGSKVLSNGALMFNSSFRGEKNYTDLLKNSIGEYLPICRTSVLKQYLLRNLRGYESVTWLTIARAGYKIFYDPHPVRLYDDEGEDRLSNRLGLIRNSGDMKDGYSIYLREFGKDLLRANPKAYLTVKAKLFCYSFIHRLKQSRAN
ncbi:glycosyltransferase [Pedobacter sp. SYSU D00535]|uniref:glycosyltransferase family 2 protein n=1 Tax=Pedobacter sp. SYSU D00535 TaxID=2810308 RepID=UPI001A9689ED|nr:glycosyltransferase [Pedobacter sp. SYSU D00535]